MTERNNQNFRNIARALKLRDSDIVEIAALGGLTISKSTANGWRRNPEAVAKQGQKRRLPMSDEQFNIFCQGLPEWLNNDTT
jgi:uncharacterized protein YehS (DUF1456 family)